MVCVERVHQEYKYYVRKGLSDDKIADYVVTLTNECDDEEDPDFALYKVTVRKGVFVYESMKNDV